MYLWPVSGGAGFFYRGINRVGTELLRATLRWVSIICLSSAAREASASPDWLRTGAGRCGTANLPVSRLVVGDRQFYNAAADFRHHTMVSADA